VESKQRVLFLAPQPFFQERGTPIAVRLLLQELAACDDTLQFDVLVYHEGHDVELPRSVQVHRIRIPSILKNFLSGIRPGASLKKLICDLFFLVDVFRLLLRSRIQGQTYSTIYAVEESVFIAWFCKVLFRIPYVYDMDSLLARQVVERWSGFRLFSPLLSLLERMAIRNASAVVPVCQALADSCRAAGAEQICLLPDIDLSATFQQNSNSSQLRRQLDIAPTALVAMYVGNFEDYQGIDLLLESYASIAQKVSSRLKVILVGGDAKQIAFYKTKAHLLGISNEIYFAGARPVSELGALLSEADILLSPRILGNNTPMKIYSYLGSGKPIVATSIESHTQVLTPEVALLAAKTPEQFGEKIVVLVESQELRDKLGAAGKALAHREFSFSAFQIRVRELSQLVRKLAGRSKCSENISDNSELVKPIEKKRASR
jgi:glycosyltransferase involved in cell wall biosynthesis